MNYFKTFLLLILLSMHLHARIWRVDNLNIHDADFIDLQAAHDGAAAGDTLFVAGTGNIYGTCTVTKKLIIIGAGYFLNENTGTQANSFGSVLGLITFNSGSEYSKLAGFKISTIILNADHITVSGIYSTNNNSPIITINANNIKVEHSYIDGISGTVGIQVTEGHAYSTISNNFIRNLRIDYSANSNMIINNILEYTILSTGNTFKNNISFTNISGENNIYFYNIGNGTQFGTENGNQSNVDMSTVFVGYPDQGSNSTDGRWQLAPGSPAIGAGENGVDCGIFGGSEPYVVSGLPDIPAIFFFSAPDSSEGASTLPVQIQGKVHR